MKETPSSLASAPPAFPAKPSTAATPSYPSTSASSSLASATNPPKISYPTTPAAYTSPGATALGAAATSPLMAPQSGRYGQDPLATGAVASSAATSNPPTGFVNPVYQNSGTTYPPVQNPYRLTPPTAPSSNGSLAAQNPSTNSQYQAALASSAAKAAAPAYSNDPNSRYYSGNESDASDTDPQFGSATMPKVASGYPSTSPAAPVVSMANAPSGSYPNIKAPAYPNTPSYPQTQTQPAASTASGSYAPSAVNVTAPVNFNSPVTSRATTTPTSDAYQPGANGYQPGANQYVPGQNGYAPAQNGYQAPAVHYSDPIQSSSQAPPMFPMVPPASGSNYSNDSQAPAFRPGSTGSVPGYPSASPYSNNQSSLPVKTSSSTSSVVPAGFNQDATTWR